MTTHLYLDIDGVLNAYDRYGDHQPDHWGTGYTMHEAGRFMLVVSPGMIARLNGLIREHDIVGHWLTTWEDDARAVGWDLGLEGSNLWPALPARGYSGGVWQKFTSIHDHLEQTQPDLAFWFDDELAFRADAALWADERPGLTAFAPTTDHGITPAMLDTLERIIKEHQ